MDILPFAGVDAQPRGTVLSHARTRGRGARPASLPGQATGSGRPPAFRRTVQCTRPVDEPAHG
jgi:hypothetical protein